jgi:hypothetical protein
MGCTTANHGPVLEFTPRGQLQETWVSKSAGVPSQSVLPTRIVGAYAGYGTGVFFPNAGSVQQLKGPVWSALILILESASVNLPCNSERTKTVHGS